jgi:hypothetical protein
MTDKIDPNDPGGKRSIPIGKVAIDVDADPDRMKEEIHSWFKAVGKLISRGRLSMKIEDGSLVLESDKPGVLQRVNPYCLEIRLKGYYHNYEPPKKKAPKKRKPLPPVQEEKFDEPA